MSLGVISCLSSQKYTYMHTYMYIWVLILKMVIYCAHCMHPAFSFNIVSWILFKMSL